MDKRCETCGWSAWHKKFEWLVCGAPLPFWVTEALPEIDEERDVLPSQGEDCAMWKAKGDD